MPMCVPSVCILSYRCILDIFFLFEIYGFCCYFVICFCLRMVTHPFGMSKNSAKSTKWQESLTSYQFLKKENTGHTFASYVVRVSASPLR